MKDLTSSLFTALPVRRARLLALAAGIALLSVSPAGAALLVDYDLGGTSQTTTIWGNLKTSNPTLAPTSGSGGFSIGAPGGQFSIGLYSPGGPYSTTATQSSVFDVQSVVFQLDVSPNGALPFSTGPLLSFNGGSQNIAATYFAVTGTELGRMTSFGPLNYTGAAWQWDLSGYGDTINSISIISPYSVHTSVAAERIDAGSSFVQVVPEPSMAGLACFGGGLMLMRRRRRVA